MTAMAASKLLIVDDDSGMRSTLRRALRQLDCQLTTAGGGVEALEALHRNDGVGFAVAIVDLCMPGMDGLEVLVEIKRRSPDTQVLLLTAHGSIASAVQAMRLGADDFLEKPFDPDGLRERIRTSLRVWSARGASDCIEADKQSKEAFSGLVGESPRMQHIRALARQLGESDVTLLIEGESGTGKEEFAKAVHYGGARAGYPFVPIDMSTLGRAVIESELFGHAKGAFTGADSAREGLLRAAGKGTVLLDEIGDLSLEMQTKLLRVLQERTARPVGSEEVFTVEARLLVATNKNLVAAVDRGEFRADLYHRLNVISVTMPPLRKRKEDIPILARHFLEKYKRERPTVKGIAEKTYRVLGVYDWPGNVRELENAILRALVVGDSDFIQVGDLPAQVANHTSQTCPRQDEDFKFDIWEAISRPYDGDTLESYERQAIVAALEKSNGNRARAAETLNIGVATLYRKLKRYNIT